MEDIRCALVCVTFPEREIASKAASVLIEKHIAAGTSLLGPFDSLFHWQKKIINRQEWLLLAHINKNLFKDCQEIIASIHTDQVPCIISLPIINGYEPFLKWILANSHPESKCK